MSVSERIEDSRLLFTANRLEGALLMVLVAVAATSAKRYPRLNDREGFIRFLQDERAKITGALKVEIEFEGTMHTLEYILYKFVRCELVHEAKLREKIYFDYGDFLLDKRGTTDSLTFSSELIIRLAYAVETASENSGATTSQLS
jgi:hypothetical protein